MPIHGAQVNIGVSTTTHVNDTAILFWGHEPFGDWESVTPGWAVNGPGVVNGTVTSINLFTDTDNFDNKTITVQIIGGKFILGQSYNFDPQYVSCFVEGTQILTQNGYKSIEMLQETDNVITSDNRAIGFKLFKWHLPITTVSTAPYIIQPNAFGKHIPATPLHLSPTHKFQIRKGLWTSPELAAKTNPLIKQYGIGEPVTYYNIECANFLKDNIIAEGAVVESYGTVKAMKGMRSIYKWNNTLMGFTRMSYSLHIKKTSKLSK